MNKFEIEIVSYFDQEEPVAEIYYAAVQWAEVTFKNNNFRIHLFSHPNGKEWNFPLDRILEVIEQAKQKLQGRLAKTTPPLFSEMPNLNGLSNQTKQVLENILSDPNKQMNQQSFISQKHNGRATLKETNNSYAERIKPKECKSFQIESCSKSSAKNLAVAVIFNGQICASLDYRRGPSSLELILFPFGVNAQGISSPLSDFTAALEHARTIAIQRFDEDQKSNPL